MDVPPYFVAAAARECSLLMVPISHNFCQMSIWYYSMMVLSSLTPFWFLRSLRLKHRRCGHNKKRQGGIHMGQFGRRQLRAEDDNLILGRGRFVDDVRFPGMLHVAIVRSQ